MNTRVLGMIGSMLLVPALVSAAPVAITWEWTLDDPEVTTFRYQLDGEDPDGWTVVDASQTSYTAENMDGSLSYTLYLQQSYDGVHFSSSATSASEPLASEEEQPVLEETTEEVVPEEAVIPEEAQPVEESPVAVEEPSVEEVAVEPEAPQEVVEEAAPVAEEVTESVVAEIQPEEKSEQEPAAPAPVEKPLKERAPFRFGLGVFGGASYLLDGDSYRVATSNHTWTPSLGGEIKIENIISTKHIGLGFDLKGAWMPDSDAGWKDTFKSSTDLYHVMDGSGVVELDVSLGKLLFTLGAGGFGSYHFDREEWAYGVVGSAGLGFQLSNHLYAGVDGQYRYYLYGNKKAQTVGGTASLLFTF